jgi:hypothetical protein
MEILWFLLDILLTISGESLIELGLRSLAEPFQEREDRSPLLAALGYALLGFIVGGLSLLIFPYAFVRGSRLHGISLVITPTLAGLAMAGLGWLRDRQGKPRIRLDSFSYGFVFAFAMTLMRFLFAG